MHRRLLILIHHTLLAGVLMAGLAYAQGYPNKPIRIIVPFGPGGSGDLTARTFGQYLEGQTKQPVIIENKPGANGIIGTEAPHSKGVIAMAGHAARQRSHQDAGKGRLSVALTWAG